jgi:hypothetical protein
MSPRDTVKWLARLIGIPVRTARFWAEQTVPVYRREEVARRMIEEYHRHTKWREEVLLPSLYRMAGLGDDVEIVSSSGIAGAAADLIGVAADRIEAAIDWIETDLTVSPQREVAE